LGWERRDFLDEDAAADARADRDAALAQARDHLGHLRIAAARSLLVPLLEAHPDDFEVRMALYRCARLEPGTPRLAEAARAVLLPPPRNAAEAREQKTVYEACLEAGA